MTHEVQVLCNCDDIERCRMEIYVSDVRIAHREVVMALSGTGSPIVPPQYGLGGKKPKSPKPPKAGKRGK